MVSGLYRFVRNPMYVAVTALIFGQAVLFASWGVALYGIVIVVAFDTFVRLYEEPTCARPMGRNTPPIAPPHPAGSPGSGNRPPAAGRFTSKCESVVDRIRRCPCNGCVFVPNYTVFAASASVPYPVPPRYPSSCEVRPQTSYFTR